MQSGLFKIYFIIKKDLNFITDKKIKEKKNNLSKNRFASISKFNGITCQSQISLNINKSGRYKFLFQGGINKNDHGCYSISKHVPFKVIINEFQVNDDQENIFLQKK